MISQIWGSWEDGKYFAAPAMIYAIYNSLSYTNLKLFNPVEFKVLINIRIPMTGLMLQCLFGQKLGMRKWIALFFLMIGCALNQLSLEDFQLTVTNPVHLLWLLLQAFLSTLGGIYSEFLIKKNIALSLNIKNIYLYLFSIVFNLTWISLVDPWTLSSFSSFTRGFDLFTITLIVVGALAGLSTALFLRFLDVIAKEYAHSAEIFLTAFVSWLFFDLQVSLRLFFSLIIVSISVFVYNTKPESLTPPPLPK